jgi:hypothetical protein
MLDTLVVGKVDVIMSTIAREPSCPDALHTQPITEVIKQYAKHFAPMDNLYTFGLKAELNGVVPVGVGVSGLVLL